MKRVRPVVFLVMLLIILSLTGCTKKNYYFSFAKEQDFINESGEWFLEGAVYEFTSGGLNLQQGNIACPLRFSGDFTVTVFFEAHVDADHTYNLGISLGDGTWYDTTENDVHMEMSNLGAGAFEERYISDHDDDYMNEYEHLYETGLIPGVVRDGYNTYIIKKTGNNISIRINDVQYANFDLVYYKSQWFGPNLYVYCDNGTDYNHGITFYDIRVEYTGNTSPMPLPEPEVL